MKHYTNMSAVPLLMESWPLWCWPCMSYVWPEHEAKPQQVRRRKIVVARHIGEIAVYWVLRPRLSTCRVALYVDQGDVKLRVGARIIRASEVTAITCDSKLFFGSVCVKTESNELSLLYVRPSFQGTIMSDGQLDTNDLDLFHNFFLIATQAQRKQDFLNAYSGMR